VERRFLIRRVLSVKLNPGRAGRPALPGAVSRCAHAFKSVEQPDTGNTGRRDVLIARRWGEISERAFDVLWNSPNHAGVE
jgi:hypothetical protein